MKDVSIVINGTVKKARVEPRLTLLDFLRDHVGLKAPMPDVNMVCVAPVQSSLMVLLSVLV